MKTYAETIGESLGAVLSGSGLGVALSGSGIGAMLSGMRSAAVLSLADGAIQTDASAAASLDFSLASNSQYVALLAL